MQKTDTACCIPASSLNSPDKVLHNEDAISTIVIRPANKSLARSCLKTAHRVLCMPRQETSDFSDSLCRVLGALQRPRSIVGYSQKRKMNLTVAFSLDKACWRHHALSQFFVKMNAGSLILLSVSRVVHTMRDLLIEK